MPRYSTQGGKYQKSPSLPPFRAHFNGPAKLPSGSSHLITQHSFQWASQASVRIVTSHHTTQYRFQWIVTIQILLTWVATFNNANLPLSFTEKDMMGWSSCNLENKQSHTWFFHWQRKYYTHWTTLITKTKDKPYSKKRFFYFYLHQLLWSSCCFSHQALFCFLFLVFIC